MMENGKHTQHQKKHHRQHTTNIIKFRIGDIINFCVKFFTAVVPDKSFKMFPVYLRTSGNLFSTYQPRKTQPNCTTKLIKFLYAAVKRRPNINFCCFGQKIDEK